MGPLKTNISNQSLAKCVGSFFKGQKAKKILYTYHGPPFRINERDLLSTIADPPFKCIGYWLRGTVVGGDAK